MRRIGSVRFLLRFQTQNKLSPPPKYIMITVVYAHPYGRRSRANKALLNAIAGLPDLEVVDLYERYPDFQIDVETEQQRLASTKLLVMQHPLHWYHTPALLSLWMEKVLSYGWAYGEGGHALQGKRFLWAHTAGGEKSAYCTEGYNQYSIKELSAPIHQTALFCGMAWQEPFTVFGAGKLSDDELMLEAERYRDRIVMEAHHAR
jgi:glutathione-regulated potassium-efflux system ancillary protein KefF